MKLPKGDYYTVEQIAKKRGVTRQALAKNKAIQKHVKTLSRNTRIIRLEDIKGV